MQHISRAQQTAAAALTRMLARVPDGGDIKELGDATELRGALQFYLGEVLSSRYREWRFEGLDGLYLSTAVKTGARNAELTGMCCLITDMTVTPFHVDLRASESGDRVEWVHCRLGERMDDGLLRIPYASNGWRKRLHLLEVASIDWVYDVEMPEAPRR
jgi:hypothetical protein